MHTAGWSAAALLAFSLSLAAIAQPRAPDLSGMWSDPPATIEGRFCYFFCTQVGLDKLEELLGDEANDDRPIPALFLEAGTFQLETYVKPRLTSAAVATLGVDPADDPGFLKCEPWAFGREIFAPHQLQIEQLADRVEMLYGEWTVRRTVYLDGREPPAGEAATPMGYSVGRYEDGALVVETTRIAANLAPWGPGAPLGGGVAVRRTARRPATRRRALHALRGRRAPVAQRDARGSLGVTRTRHAAKGVGLGARAGDRAVRQL